MEKKDIDKALTDAAFRAIIDQSAEVREAERSSLQALTFFVVGAAALGSLCWNVLASFISNGTPLDARVLWPTVTAALFLGFLLVAVGFNSYRRARDATARIIEIEAELSKQFGFDESQLRAFRPTKQAIPARWWQSKADAVVSGICMLAGVCVTVQTLIWLLTMAKT